MKRIYISSCDKNGGIYRYGLDGGKLTFADKTPLDRPMYTVCENKKMYVILKETDISTGFGGLMSFDIAKDGGLVNPSKITSTNGICPCHLAVKNGVCYTVNYLSGNIVSSNGKIHSHSGKGINLPRQDAPHTHYVNLSPDGKYLLSCDLGLDGIYTYDFDLNVISVANVPKGHGARHLDYSDDGKYVYCVNELASTVSTFEYDDGKLILKNTYPCMFRDGIKNTAAAIRFVNGRLYVSNRGDDTVTCFAVSEDRLETVFTQSVEGSFPRDMLIVDGHIIFTNEHTNNVTVFRLSENGMEKTDTAENITDPLCVTEI